MSTLENLLAITEIPKGEVEFFDEIIKNHRKVYIKPPSESVSEIFLSNPNLLNQLSKEKNATEVIGAVREIAWGKYLQDEAVFNTQVILSLGSVLQTPKTIIEKIIEQKLVDKSGDKLIENIKIICGEYAGRIMPYLYALCLSNTNSRRSRAGQTFQSIIYKMYDILSYPFDSQKKVGKKAFQDKGLGKIVDSILPGIERFGERRDKTIIGTMKTTLRERWQEVSEEISRTNVPNIFLLTIDDEISKSKAEQMRQHNIILVVPKAVKNNEGLNGMKNVITFEEYFFQEIPNMLSYWKNYV
jgi:hypothetical protein